VTGVGDVSGTERQGRFPRQGTDWAGTYQVENGTWRVCQILDISILGVGLELRGPIQMDLIGREITVEVQTLAGASISLRMSGEIRNVVAAVSPHVGTRIGIEFGELSDTEKAIFQVLGHTLVPHRISPAPMPVSSRGTRSLALRSRAARSPRGLWWRREQTLV
jgi:hypothetical protein